MLDGPQRVGVGEVEVVGARLDGVDDAADILDQADQVVGAPAATAR